MQNKEQVVATVEEGLEAHRRFKTAELGLHKAQRNLREWEQEYADAQRQREAIQVKIKALGFHDIGHARTELAKPEETK
jgi:hypothetical protein